MSDLFDEIPEEISPELRKELMDLATSARSLAARIDAIVQRKQVKEADANNEPTFKFGAKVLIPNGFFLTKRMSQYALDRGFKEAEIKNMADGFVIYYNKTGKKWQDWTRVWQDWVRREQVRRGGGAPVTSDRLKRW